jgi:hypothetical protein
MAMQHRLECNWICVVRTFNCASANEHQRPESVLWNPIRDCDRASSLWRWIVVNSGELKTGRQAVRQRGIQKLRGEVFQGKTAN